jgi:hypothetical protein
MHGDVDGACQQGLFDLAGEQALAADLFQGAVLNLVAGDLDHHDLECPGRQGKGGGKAVARLMGLRQRQRAAARADLEGTVGGGKAVGHDASLSCDRCAVQLPAA